MKRSVLCHFHKRKPAKKLANKDIYLNPNNISQYPIRNSSLLRHFVWLHAAQNAKGGPSLRSPGHGSWPFLSTRKHLDRERPLNLWHILMIIMVMFNGLVCWGKS